MSPAALVTVWCHVMQPTVARRVRNIIAVTRACGSRSFLVMLDLHLSVTPSIVPCRAFTSRYTGASATDGSAEASGAIVARIRFRGGLWRMNGRGPVELRAHRRCAQR